MDLLPRALIGLAGAAVIAAVSRRSGLLTTSGAVAALVCGTVTMSAGWPFAVGLLTFFFSATALSRWSRQRGGPSRRIVDKPGARDGTQVLANGGVMAVAAAGALMNADPLWLLAGLGAMGAATADTWATEVGTAVGGVPRALLTWRAVTPGTSGAVSAAGTVAMCAGAIVLGGVAWWSSATPRGAWSVVVAGVAGALIDTLLGATVQERRWCGACQESTEQAVHVCGTRSDHKGGIAGLTNDVVNIVCTMTGALTAVALAQ